MTAVKETPALRPRAFTLAGCEGYAGMSVAFWKKRVADGTLPSFKIGKRRLVLVDDLDRFLDERRGARK